MLGDRGLSQRQLIDDIAAHAGRAAREETQDLDPCRVADRLGEPGKLRSSPKQPQGARRSPRRQGGSIQ